MYKYFKKDGKTYFFESKVFDDFNYLYGITPKKKQIVDNNLESQRNYLKNAFVNFNDESFINLFDINFSANIKPKQYYGEMFNRVSTLQKYAKANKFDTPIFITLTPPSHLKPLKQIRLGNSNKYKLVDNPKFCGSLDYVDLAREYISNKWTKFLRQRLFTEMKNKYNERLIYMRTYEPFLDGTPHVHIVAFIPNEYKQRFINLVKNYFSDTRTDVKSEFDNGVGGVVAYILKYILKSFTNSQDNKLDDVGYWYAYNKIRRFTTSRTLIPMSIYRKMKQHDEYKNLLEVTNLYKNNYIQVEVIYNSWKLYSKNHSEINSTDFQIAKITVISNDTGFETHFNIVYEKSDNVSLYFVKPDSKSSKPFKIDINKSKEKFTEQKNKQKCIPVDINGEKFILYNDVLKKLVKVPAQMKDYELYRYYLSLDPENDENLNLHHFGITKNECIKRGLIDEELVSLNLYTTDFQI
ncbi:replication endonuclease [Sulfurospirillum sp. 1307]